MKLIVFSGLLAWGALAALPAAGQEPGDVRETAEVALVEVPVRVVDRDGQPVRGLTEANFTVQDDGRPQRIVGFDTIDLAEKVLAGQGPAAPAARRRFLILFDFAFSRPKSILVARKAARDFVLSGMAERDLAAVATYSVEQGVRLLVTFSSDRAQLAQAIESLGLEARHESTDPLAFAFDTATLAAIVSARSGRAQAEGLIETLQTFSAINRARSDEYTRGRVRQLFQAFRDLSQSLNSVEGRKDILYLSEGFSGRHLVGTSETEEERQSLLHGEIWKVDADKRFGSTPLRNELTEVGEWFRRSDCVVHAVDIAGIRAESDPESDPAPAGPRDNGELALRDRAGDRGRGAAQHERPRRAARSRVLQQTSLVYVLAFRPDRAGPEGAFHPLKVKVSVPGARVWRGPVTTTAAASAPVAARAAPARGRRHRQRDSPRRHPDPGARHARSPTARSRPCPCCWRSRARRCSPGTRARSSASRSTSMRSGRDDRLRDFFVRTHLGRPGEEPRRS